MRRRKPNQVTGGSPGGPASPIPAPARAATPDPAGLAAEVVDALPAHIAVLDGNGRIELVNRAWVSFARANGVPGGEAFLGSDYLAVLRAARGSGAKDAEACLKGIEAVLSGATDAFRYDYACHGAGQNRWFEMTASPLRRGGAVIAHHDVTARKLQEIDLAHLARHDALTELPNRSYFLDLAGAFREAHALGGRPFALVFVDLDDFKQVNDGRGHAAGDALLREVAARLRDAVRPSDVVARIGGDEFALLLSGLLPAGEEVVAERISAALRASPGRDDPRAVAHASLGFAYFPRDGRDIRALLERADGAMYRRKRRRKRAR